MRRHLAIATVFMGVVGMSQAQDARAPCLSEARQATCAGIDHRLTPAKKAWFSHAIDRVLDDVPGAD